MNEKMMTNTNVTETEDKITSFKDLVVNSSHKCYNNIIVVNTTPHPVSIMDNDSIVDVPTGVLINATPTQEEVGPVGTDGMYITTIFKPNVTGWDTIEAIKKCFNSDENVVIVGSIIAAQAYPGYVCGLVPYPGYERTAQKLMRCDRFNVFLK